MVSSATAARLGTFVDGATISLASVGVAQPMARDVICTAWIRIGNRTPYLNECPNEIGNAIEYPNFENYLFETAIAATVTAKH